MALQWRSSFFVVLIASTAAFAVIPPVASYEEEVAAPTPIAQEVIRKLKYGRHHIKREIKQKRYTDGMAEKKVKVKSVPGDGEYKRVIETKTEGPAGVVERKTVIRRDDGVAIKREIKAY